MNTDYLRQEIDSKFPSVEAFASAIKVTKVAVYKWLNGETSPEDNRIFDIAEALELSEQQINRLLGVPDTVVLFRNKRGTVTDVKTVTRGKELAETFFKIGQASYVVRESVPITEEESPQAIAALARTLLNIKPDEPVKFQELLLGLQKHNLSVFFLPFAKLGIKLVDQHEVAFTAKQGSKIIIFIDTARTIDEVTFDLCHELCHVLTRKQKDISEVYEIDDAKEKLCDSVAEELIYPTGFFAVKKQELAAFSNEKLSQPEVLEHFVKLWSEFDWSPKGLARALESRKYIRADTDAYSRLLELGRLFERHQKPLDTMYYSTFQPDSFDMLKTFFSDELAKNKQLFRPFIEIKNAASFGRINYRKLAELLVIDTGDADELIKSWRTDDNPICG